MDSLCPKPQQLMYKLWNKKYNFVVVTIVNWLLQHDYFYKVTINKYIKQIKLYKKTATSIVSSILFTETECCVVYVPSIK